MKLQFLFIGILSAFAAAAQPTPKQLYTSEQKKIGNAFSNYFYPNYAAIYSLPEKDFTRTIDSARAIFDSLWYSFRSQLDEKFAADESVGIKYYFDKLLVDYPTNHWTYTGKPTVASPAIRQIIERNLPDLNNSQLLSNTDLREYAKTFFYFHETAALKKGLYKKSDNQHLEATWDIISRYITDTACAQAWKYEYLHNHIENYGIKNIDRIYKDFLSTSTNDDYRNKVISMYKEDSAGRQGHVIKTYKTAGPFALDIHIFLPSDSTNSGKRPVIAYFHGGSWSEGKPDWFFSACKSYAKQGWVACAVEYRISGRHGSLPFQSVMDARSAIRWLRKNAAELNIDTGRIVASGNSAGGHLVLSTVLADKWNERSDDLSISPVPNVLLVNAGVYDLTDTRTAWIRKELKDKNAVKQISPNHLVKKNMPPTLLIHGTKDGSVPYETARAFEEAMRKAGNNFEFHTLENAPHYIWYDRSYAPTVSKLRTDFLKKLGY